MSLDTWTTAQIEAERQRVADLVTDARICLRLLADRRSDTFDGDRNVAFGSALIHLDSAAAALSIAKRTTNARTIEAHAVAAGDLIFAEDSWLNVEATHRYDGWVSITVPGMELRFRESELVWTR